MTDKPLINKKIAQIIKYIEELKPLAKIDYSEFVNDYKIFRTAERNLQLIVDSCIDINNHIILEKNLNQADDYYTSFINLAGNVYSEKFAKKIAQAAGLRNKLVHVYETIDLEKLYEYLNDDLKDFEKYIKYIKKFINKK